MTDWPAVVREYGPLVWRTAYRLVGNDAAAADCFQQTFLAAAGPGRHWGGTLRRLATARGRKEGADDVGGVKADRYTVVVERKEDPRDYRMWVDPRTGWPVKVEATGTVDLKDLFPGTAAGRLHDHRRPLRVGRTAGRDAVPPGRAARLGGRRRPAGAPAAREVAACGLRYVTELVAAG